MMQPEGFVDPKGTNQICKLHRSIYGLVQAFRSWNIRFDELIKAYGFRENFVFATLVFANFAYATL